jgi:hypothetical protein
MIPSVAQELAQPIRGWMAVEDYYRRATDLLEMVDVMTLGDVSIDLLGDVAIAHCTFHFEGAVRGRSEPRIADGRNTFLFRRMTPGVEDDPLPRVEAGPSVVRGAIDLFSRKLASTTRHADRRGSI